MRKVLAVGVVVITMLLAYTMGSNDTEAYIPSYSDETIAITHLISTGAIDVDDINNYEIELVGARDKYVIKFKANYKDGDIVIPDRHTYVLNRKYAEELYVY